MSDDVTPGNLARELGLTAAEAQQLRKGVEFGRIMPPIRISQTTEHEVQSTPDSNPAEDSAE